MSFAVLGLAALAADATAQAPCGGGIQQFTPRFAISGGAAGPDGRSLWLLSGSPSSSFGRLLRVNLATGAAARPIRLPGSPSDIAIGFRAVSVTAVVGPRQEPVVLRVNPRTRRVAAVVRLRPRGRLGSFLTATRSAIWVGGGDRSFRDIFVISPRSNRVTHTIHPGAASVADLVADDDSVWASGAQAVLRLDPSGRVNVRLNVEGFVLATGVGSSVVWAAQPFVGEPMPTVNGRLLEVASTGATSQHQVRGLPVALIGSRDGVWTVEQQPNRLRLLC